MYLFFLYGYTNEVYPLRFCSRIFLADVLWGLIMRLFFQNLQKYNIEYYGVQTFPFYAVVTEVGLIKISTEEMLEYNEMHGIPNFCRLR